MQTLLKETGAYRLLKAERDKNRLHHAYLLLLDDKRNLREAVKTFAKLLFFCEEADTPEAARISSLIDGEIFSDCLIFPKTDKKFTVAETEDILEEIPLKPIEGGKKVFLVADFAEATAQAQNKLLKVLEEPPENVFFLLGATSSYPVLSTVLSRTEKLEILPFTERQVADCLRRLYKDEAFSERELILSAAASSGSVGTAQNILDGGYYKELTQKAFELCSAGLSSLPIAVKKAADIKYKKEFLSFLKLVFRDAFLYKAKTHDVSFGSLGESYLFLPTEKDKVRAISENYSLSALLYAQEALTEAEKEVFFNANFPQCIEIALSKILWKNKSVL